MLKAADITVIRKAGGDATYMRADVRQENDEAIAHHS